MRLNMGYRTAWRSDGLSPIGATMRRCHSDVAPLLELESPKGQRKDKTMIDHPRQGLTGNVTMFPTDVELERQEKAETAVEHKPVHGGYPDYPRVMVVGDGGKVVRDDFSETIAINNLLRGEAPSNPIPGSEWNVERPLPAIYFEAVRLSTAMNDLVHDAQVRAWKVTTATRAVRLAETIDQQTIAVEHLSHLYKEYMATADVELKVRMLINDLTNVVDHTAPSQSPMFRQVRQFIDRVSRAFKRSDA